MRSRIERTGQASRPRRPRRLQDLRTSLPRVLKQIFGAPDYAAYLEHCRRAGHAPGLTEQQFVEEFFATKGKRLRCC